MPPVSAEERWQAANRRRQHRGYIRDEEVQEDSVSSSYSILDKLVIGVFGIGAAVIFVAMLVIMTPWDGVGKSRGDDGHGGIMPDGAGGGKWSIDQPAKVATPPEASAFVSVRDGKFEVFCRPFYVAGFNAHDLVEISMQDAKKFRMENGVSGHLRVRETFREASAAGLNIVRIWGFTNHMKFPFQKSPGDYDQDALEGLDYVLSEARQYGIRVIVVLTDNWKYLNGADQYVDWSTTAPKRTQQRPKDDYGEPVDLGLTSSYEGTRHSLFFSDEGAKQLYKSHVAAMLGRRNHIHGRLYKDDPTIFAWELMNEPRCNIAVNPRCTAIVQEWINEMSNHIKRIDSNHIVSVGQEGFFGGGYEWSRANPGRWAENVGQAFMKNHGLSTIDFGAIHSWPDNWDRTDLKFQEEWVRAHGKVATEILRKPFLLEEFGKRLPPDRRDSEIDIKQTRDPLFANTLKVISEGIQQGDSYGGALFWRLHLSTYEGKGRGRYGVRTSDSTFYYIKKFAADVHSATNSRPPWPTCQAECWIPYQEESRNLCVQDSNACKVYWDVKNGGSKRNASEVLVPVWDQEVPLSELKFFTSWLDCCRKGVGAFEDGCDFDSGFPSW